ncbi:MAG: hypothetical protein ACXV9S_07135 [Acidimicrobiia bacterium]
MADVESVALRILPILPGGARRFGGSGRQDAATVRSSHPPSERGDMARGRESFEKRAREIKRQARAASKRERREERATTDADAPVVDEEALMARYGELSKQREAGEIDEATFETERVAIFVELGLVPAGEE